MVGHGWNEIVVFILGVAAAGIIAIVFARSRNAADNARLKGCIDQLGDEVSRLRVEFEKLRNEVAVMRRVGAQQSGAAAETRIKES